MKVYAVMYNVSYEGSSLHSTFSTNKKAEHFLSPFQKKGNKERGWYWVITKDDKYFTIEEHEINKFDGEIYNERIHGFI